MKDHNIAPVSDFEFSNDSVADTDCFFISGLKADGKPFNYHLHKNVGISGGPGPMGSIESRSVRIPIPRSKKALFMHRTGFFLKVLFFIIALIPLRIELFPSQGLITEIAISLSVLLAGGIITQLVYQVNKTRSKFFFAHNYLMVKKYKKNGYRRGFHPMFSTTPVGAFAWILRLIF